MTTVVLLGGTFDPVHRGHLALARAALALDDVSEVRLVPSPSPPHKSGAEASYGDRVEMCRRAVAEMEAMEVWEAEADRRGPAFTIDTMNEAARRLAPRPVAFLMGADGLAELPTWKDPDGLVSSHRVMVAVRPGWDPWTVGGEFVERIERIEMAPDDVTSTAIRQRVRKGEPIEAWVGAPVADYIRERHLYRTTS